MTTPMLSQNSCKPITMRLRAIFTLSLYPLIPQKTAINTAVAPRYACMYQGARQDSDEIRPMRRNPCANRNQDPTRVGGTLLCNRIGNRDAAIIGQIARSSVRVEDANPVGSDSGGLWQCLNQELMVTGLTRCGTIAVRHHGG